MATVAAVEHRVNELQQALLELVRQNDRTARTVDRTSAGLDRLSDEMRGFKDETRKANADPRDSLARQNAELSRALGTLAEDILGPSIPTLFKRFLPGNEPEFAMRALKRHRVSGDRREFDTPAWNDKVFLIPETKARLRPGDLDSLSETIAEVRNFSPRPMARKSAAPSHRCTSTPVSSPRVNERASS